MPGSLLLGTQRDDRVHTTRELAGKPDRDERNHGQQERNAHEHHRIMRGHAKEEAVQHTRQSERRRDTEEDAGQRTRMPWPITM